LIGRNAQYGFAVCGRNKHVVCRRSRHQWDGRYRQHDLEGLVYRPSKVDHLDQVGRDFVYREVVELVTVRIELACDGSRTSREDGAILTRYPSFGESEGEDEY
jgi:hypothetical protein